MVPHDVLADLPPARDDEPASLRRDIADELTDHLACAFHRELVKTGDEAQAKDRVLERFGDPRKIARQLWWQAMWSRIMLQKISIGLQSVLAVVLVVLVGLQFNAQQHQALLTVETSTLRQQTAANQRLLAQLVEQLRDVDLPKRTPSENASGWMGSMGSAMGEGGELGGTSSAMEGAAPGNMSAMAGMPGMMSGEGDMAVPLPAGASTLSLVLTMETEDGPPAHGCLVAILDDAEKPLPLSFQTSSPDMIAGAYDSGGAYLGGGFSGGPPLKAVNNAPGFLVSAKAQGRIDAGRVDPGRYTVAVEFPNGWMAHHRVAVRPGERRVEKIACPMPAEKAFVTITGTPLPEDLRAASVRLVATVAPRATKLNGIAWGLLETGQRKIVFDATTGLTTDVLISQVTGYTEGRPRRHWKPTSFTTEPAEDRFVVLPTGHYEVFLTLYRIEAGTKEDFDLRGAMESVRPDLQLAPQPDSTDFTPGREFTIRAGQNAWQLELSEELLDSARMVIAKKNPL